ncbi:MAG: aldehyde ferredoxin oxidoreductase [Lachnospiraceae bacterium]|nr:aldehyde ferredoxin oxidoreductase [Lachnospiraceae bacterium]
MATYGWAGQILRINLTTGAITTEDDSHLQKYIGGMGMGYRILYDEVPMNTPPRDEASKFFMGVGPLTGAGVPCSGRMNITFLSSWSKGHSILDAHMGGHIGPQLKYAGYDGVIVEGKSATPVYIKIDDDKVSIEDASAVWGKGTFEANKMLTEACGRDFETAAIGPAGEHQVNYSTLNTSFGNSAGAGIGALMGSKNLKGIAIRGTGSVKIADVTELKRLNDYMLKDLIGANNNHNVPAVPQSWAEYSAVGGKNRWSGAPGRRWEKAEGGPIDMGEQPCGDINKIAYRTLKGVFDYGEVASKYIVKQGGCSSCPIRCYTEYDMDPLADYDLPTATSNTCMPVLYADYFYPDGIKDFVDQGDAKVILNGAGSHAQDDLGVWCNYGNLYREFNWLCKSEKIKEVLPEAEYNSIPWEWERNCDPRFVVEIMRRIAYKEGELATLGEGTIAVQEKWNLGQEWMDMVAGNNQNITYNGYPKHHGPEDSAQIGMLFNLMYNRDCMIHHLVNITGSGAPYEVSKKVMEGFFGEGCYDNKKAYTPMNRNKAKVAKWAFNGKQFHDSGTVCNWMWPMTQSPSKERGYAGDLNLEADFMKAVTGVDYTRESLEFDSERISQMLRVMTAISFHNEFGATELRNTHDAIPAWVFEKEPDFQAFQEGTIKLDRADMELAKDMFYEEMGWDVATGIPTRATLEKFDLKDMADDLEKRGILPA